MNQFGQLARLPIETKCMRRNKRAKTAMANRNIQKKEHDFSFWGVNFASIFIQRSRHNGAQAQMFAHPNNEGIFEEGERVIVSGSGRTACASWTGRHATVDANTHGAGGQTCRQKSCKTWNPLKHKLFVFTHRRAQIGASCRYYQNKRGWVCVRVGEKWRRRAAHQSHPSREANSAQHRVQASQHLIHTNKTETHTYRLHVHSVMPLWGLQLSGRWDGGAHNYQSLLKNIVWPGLSQINTQIINFFDPNPK